MKTLLFVDDDEAFREIFRRIFEEEGYRVLLAEDGQEAIAAVKSTCLDAVILDVRMPRMSGLDVAEMITAIKPHLPIILYTANDEICMIDRRALLAAACVDKSVDFTELARTVSRVLTPDNSCPAFRFGLPQESSALQRTSRASGTTERGD